MLTDFLKIQIVYISLYFKCFNWNRIYIQYYIGFTNTLAIHQLLYTFLNAHHDKCIPPVTIQGYYNIMNYIPQAVLPFLCLNYFIIWSLYLLSPSPSRLFIFLFTFSLLLFILLWPFKGMPTLPGSWAKLRDAKAK